MNASTVAGECVGAGTTDRYGIDGRSLGGDENRPVNHPMSTAFDGQFGLSV